MRNRIRGTAEGLKARLRKGMHLRMLYSPSGPLHDICRVTAISEKGIELVDEATPNPFLVKWPKGEDGVEVWEGGFSFLEDDAYRWAFSIMEDEMTEPGSPG